jgi:hypothetical protein
MTRFFLPRSPEPLTGANAPRIREFPQQGRPVRTPHLPLRGMAPTAAELVARDIVSILLVPAVLLLVWYAASEGFRVSVPVEREETDSPASEVMP